MQARNLAACSHPALLVRDGMLVQISESAGGLFPGLKVGAPLPDALAAPEGEETWDGCVMLEGRGWRVSARKEGEDTLYDLFPLEQRALTQGQLDSSLYQLRVLMDRFRREIGPYVSGEKRTVEEEDRAQFARDYYRMLRLVEHLDLMRDAADAQLRIRSEVLEVGTLLFRTVLECDGLLRERGISVVYQGLPANLMVQGDSVRLRTALLDLISNSARRLKEGNTITVKLSKKGNRALLCVTDDGPAASKFQRAAMTTRGGLPRIPMGDMGAGLGLSVAEEIVRAHGGALLIAAGEGAPRVWISLPVSRSLGIGKLPLETDEIKGDMSPYMIGLSDVLPGSMILKDWMK